jgi:hypothetical protein
MRKKVNYCAKKICMFPISSCINLGRVGHDNRTVCLVSASTSKNKFP